MSAGWFAAVNAVLVIALSQAEVWANEMASTRVLALWPYAFGVAALGALLVAQGLEPAARSRFLARHVLLALVPLAGYAAYPPQREVEWWALLYAGFALAFSLHSVAALWSAAPRLEDRRLATILAGALLAAQLALLPYTALAIMPEADEPHYLVIAQSIAFDRDLDLTNDYRIERYGEFYPGVLADPHAIQVGPRLYPIRDLGLPLAAALPFAIAGRSGVLVLIAVVSAVVVAQLYLLLRDLRISPRIAVLATAFVALTHPFHTYATQIYPEMLVALCGLLAVRAMRRGSSMQMRNAVLAAALIATLPWLTTRAWFFAGGLALVLGAVLVAPLARPGARSAAVRRLVAAFLPAAAIVTALLSLNWAMFGIPIPGAGFYLVSDQQVVLSGEPLLGAGGLLFGRVFGLMGRAPIYLLAFVGLAAMLRRARDHGPLVAALTLGWLMHFAFIASLEHWHSDWSPPSRNLVATIPFLAVAVATGLETLSASGTRLASGISLASGVRFALGGATAAVAAWSLLISLILGAAPHLRYELPVRLRETGAPARLWTFLQDSLGGLDVSRLWPLTITPTPRTTPLLLTWLTVGLALALWGWLLNERTSAGRRH